MEAEDGAETLSNVLEALGPISTTEEGGSKAGWEGQLLRVLETEKL